MPKIKKEELDRVYNSLHRPKERVLPANEKKPRRVDFASDIKTQKPIVYLVDGYNLMHFVDEIRQIAATDLISAREKVIDIVADYQGYTGKECFLIFDAYRSSSSVPTVSRKTNITVVYTKINQTADTYIEQMCQEIGEDCKIFVVTSDNLEQLKILAGNAFRLSCSEFMRRYENLKKRYSDHGRLKRKQPLFELRKLLFEDQ